MFTLEPLRGLVVLDEIQRRPDLFAPLRVLADRPGIPAGFLILGSASPQLIRASSESLAGRVADHELAGLGLAEVGEERRQQCYGAEAEIVIARNGRPAARLVPLAARSVQQRIGIAAGRFKVPESIDRTNALVEQLFADDPSP